MLFYCRQLSSCSLYDNYVSVVRDADSDTDDAMLQAALSASMADADPW